MRCPSCQNDIPENQFYCPICRAAVYSYVPESTQKKRGMLERAGRRLLDLAILAVLIGAAVVLAKAIKWNELLGLKSATQVSPSTKPDRNSGSSGKQNKASNDSQNSQKKSETSAASDSPKEPSQKADEVSAPSDSKPAAKPTATATPKPANTGK